MLTVRIYNPSATDTIGPGRATILPSPFDWVVIPPLVQKDIPCTLNDLGHKDHNTGRTPAEGLQLLQQRGKIIVTFIDITDDTDIPDKPYLVPGIGPYDDDSGGGGGGGGGGSGFSIISFNFASFSGTLEIGQSLVNPNFTASYSSPPTSATIDDQTGAVPVIPPLTAFTISKTYTKTVINSTNTWTLAATDGVGSDTSIISCAWRPLVYYGVATPPMMIDASFVIGTIKPQGNSLASSRQRTIVYNSGVTEKLYYVFPTVFGGLPSNFIDSVTGFPAGFAKTATLTITNTYAVAVSYDVWESDQIGLGDVILNVT